MVAQTFGGLPIDGIRCETMEGAVEHIHSQLQIYDRGHRVVVPANVGIAQTYGCLYWVHTHTAEGYIHIESPVRAQFTLGQFFDIWDQPLSWHQIASVSAPKGQRLSIWVNGKAWHGSDPRTIVLKDHETIVVQNGPPFAKPAAADWNNL